MSFIKKVEDFICEHCGIAVKGTGYTNHCPNCLWSKHVDIDPGDRAEMCGGMMEPVALEGSTPNYRLLHHCTKCGAERRVHISESDNPTALLALAQKRMP